MSPTQPLVSKLLTALNIAWITIFLNSNFLFTILSFYSHLISGCNTVHEPCLNLQWPLHFSMTGFLHCSLSCVRPSWRVMARCLRMRILTRRKRRRSTTAIGSTRRGLASLTVRTRWSCRRRESARRRCSTLRRFSARSLAERWRCTPVSWISQFFCVVGILIITIKQTWLIDWLKV